MKINHVQHIAINTVDIEASIAFYRDILGLRLEKRVDMGDATLCYLHVSGDTYLELFDLNGLCEETLDHNEFSGGLRHLAFDVDPAEFDDWAKLLKEKDIPFVLDPVDMPPLQKRGMLFAAPEGTILEICCNL